MTEVTDTAAAPAQPIAAGTKASRIRLGSPIAWIGLVVLIGAWIVSVQVFNIPSYILPRPEAVVRALWSGLAVSPTSSLGYYLPLWGTLSNAAIGFAIGVALGLVIGSLMAEVPAIERLVMPYAFALQSLPKVAIAPLVVIWFGFGDGSKIAIAALLSFFPVLINSFTGLRAVEPERLDLMRCLAPSSRNSWARSAAWASSSPRHRRCPTWPACSPPSSFWAYSASSCTRSCAGPRPASCTGAPIAINNPGRIK